MRRFEGRSALVTGSGYGIGAAIARRLAAEGAGVTVADLDAPAARQVAGELDAGRGVLLDVTDEASVTAVMEAHVAEFGGIDVLVNVAGGDMPGSFEGLTDDEWHRMLDLNLVGTARCIRAALQSLRASNHPAVVCTGSVNGLAAFGGEPYSAAKAGLVSLVQNLAAEYGPAGVRVNLVAPGTIRTRVWDDQPGALDRARSLYPLGRVGEPEDVAAAVAFLASDDAAWVTGVTLPVDGGVLTGPLATFGGQ